MVNGITNRMVNPNEFRDQVKKFILDNGIVGTAAGVCIAVSTKDTIQSLVNDLIMPAIYLFIVTINSSYFGKSLLGKSLLKTQPIDFPKFLNQFISWIFVVIMTFVFVRYVFGNLFGVNATSSPIVEEKTIAKNTIVGAVASSNVSKK